MEIGERARMLARSLQGRESRVSSIDDLIGLVDSEPPKEPRLDVRTLEIVADMMERRQVLVDLYQRNRQRLADVSRESGVPEVELFTLLLGLH